MMSIDINSSTYIDCEVKNTDKYPTFVVVDHLRIWKYPIFCTALWTYVTGEIHSEETVGTFCDKLYVKWKGYGNLFNSWIKKIII